MIHSSAHLGRGIHLGCGAQKIDDRRGNNENKINSHQNAQHGADAARLKIVFKLTKY